MSPAIRCLWVQQLEEVVWGTSDEGLGVVMTLDMVDEGVRGIFPVDEVTWNS